MGAEIASHFHLKFQFQIRFCDLKLARFWPDFVAAFQQQTTYVTEFSGFFFACLSGWEN